jgi:ribosomal protein L11 methyltransferase
VLAALLELAPAGVEQVDAGEEVELAVYGAPGELPELSEAEADLGGVRVSVSATQVPDDWTERWKRFHVPILVADRLYVRPPWDDATGPNGAMELTIDPGQAFGTGAHATTRLALELLLELADGLPGASFCDLGCGSGVLSIAAARLGFSPVTALDNDPLAVTAASENARRNHVQLDRIERFDLRESMPLPAAEVLAANLTRPLLLRLAQAMQEAPLALVASGLLNEEVDEVVAAFEPLRELRRLSRGGWSGLLLVP